MDGSADRSLARRFSKFVLPVLSLGLIAAGVSLAASAAAQKSVTVDEFSVLPHGLAILRTGQFQLDSGVPPLANELSALFLIGTEAKLDTSRSTEWQSTWQVGKEFMGQNFADYHRWFMRGRIAPLLFLLLTAVLAFDLARNLHGPLGGLLAAATVSATPNLLAHGALVTPDIFVTAGLIGSFWAFDKLLMRPSPAAAALLGIFLGVACLAKFTGLLILIFIPLILAGIQIVDRKRHQPNPIGPQHWIGLAIAYGVCLLLINAVYGFADVLLPLARFEFQTQAFNDLRDGAGWLPMPMPRSYITGMDTQLHEQGYVAYLLGEFNDVGFLHYYAVGLLVKTPAPILFLAVWALIRKPRIDRREVAMVATTALLFLFFSISKHKNIGVRYVLFVEPVLAVWIARLATTLTTPLRNSRAAWAIAGALTWLWVATIYAWPSYLAYFNEPSGGPSKGHEYLLDSNIDWGQDLMALRDYMAEEGIEEVELAYFGRVDPAVYGVRYIDFLGVQKPRKRWVAISANLLWGRMYFINGGGYWPPGRDTYAAFRGLEPKAILGSTIYVYDTERLRPKVR
jgi:4-amino-4-deoxy-L-arabinose transferase-like glycosyltransferase